MIERRHRRGTTAAVVAALGTLLACSGEDGNSEDGEDATGGSAATGAAEPVSGGTTPGSGGATGDGGDPATGGAEASGATGGRTPTGGAGGASVSSVKVTRRFVVPCAPECGTTPVIWFVAWPKADLVERPSAASRTMSVTKQENRFPPIPGELDFITRAPSLGSSEDSPASGSHRG